MNKYKKRNGVRKKYVKYLLSTFLVFVSVNLPIMTNEIYATANIKEPSKSSYLVLDDLAESGYYSSYNLFGGKTQKILYGHEIDSPLTKQTWYVAGYEDKSLVLLCDPMQPFAHKQIYDKDSYFYRDSQLRKYLDNEALRKCFSEDEQIYMKTNDKLYDCKLYPPDRIIHSHDSVDYDSWEKYDYFCVGSDGAFRVSLSPGNVFGSGEEFWLRCEYDYWFGTAKGALYAIPGSRVFHEYIGSEKAVVPECHINMSSFLFASAVPETSAVETSTTLVGDEAMIMRFDSSKDESRKKAEERISTNINIYYDGISISDAKEGEYLYVQWRQNGIDKYYSCKAVNGTISAEAIGGSGFGLTKNCKVWVEKQENEGGIVYAKNATYETYTVKRGDNLTKIAKELDTSVSNLVIINSIKNPNIIWVDQVLYY